MNNTIALKSNNYGQIAGKLVSIDGKFEIEDEKFYEGKLEVERLSDTVDILPFTISEKLIKAFKLSLQKGEELAFGGELRSYNKVVDGKSRLILSFFVKEVLEIKNLPENNTNLLQLVGYICKAPTFRITPFNRQICDVLIAVNRLNFNKSDYLPCILWGRNACLMQNQKIGTKVNLVGRIQSRVYKKEVSSGVFEERIAYEVSGQKLLIVESASEDSTSEIGA